MKDRTVLQNARNMLLVTASSFCLSAAANALPQQESSSQAETRCQCSERNDASSNEAGEDEQCARSLFHRFVLKPLA